MEKIFEPLLGGVIIGLASSFLFLGVGRISGISSIVAQLLSKPVKQEFWKYFFLLGLLAGGGVLFLISPDKGNVTLDNSKVEIILAGLFVGFGTRLGSGCTSGHGVCGISRVSKRSIIATMTFMFAGILTVLVKGVL